MDYSLKVNDQPISDSVQGFMLLLRFDVDLADSALYIGRGFFAVQMTQEGMPTHKPLPGKLAKYEISGSAGVGSFTLENLFPKMTLESQVLGESSVLHLAEFDSKKDPLTWVHTGPWKQKNPLEGIVGKMNDDSATQNRNFHRGKLGAGDLRYCSHIQATSGATVTDKLVVCAPFAASPLIGTLAAKASYKPAKRVEHMPVLELETTYNQRPAETKPGADKASAKAAPKPAAKGGEKGVEKGKWTHFPGKSEAIGGQVEGYAMVAQGAFGEIRPGDFDNWLIKPALSAEDLFPRLKDLVEGFAETPRRLYNLFDVNVRNSVKLTATQMAPTEVLYLKGLGSVLPVFSA